MPKNKYQDKILYTLYKMRLKFLLFGISKKTLSPTFRTKKNDEREIKGEVKKSCTVIDFYFRLDTR